MQQYRA